MGFLDKLLNAFKKQDNSLSAEINEAVPSEKDAPSEGQTPTEIIASGNEAPKPYFTVEQEFGDKKYSFELSHDFIEFNSHSEADPAFQYEPYNDEEFTEYDGRLPELYICPDDDIYDACEFSESGEGSTDLTLSPCSQKSFLFSTEFEKYGLIYYAYGFDSGSARETEMLCVSYSPDVKGTALERKLRAALDHAAETYTESELS
ncbi:MAG: hypothetical protein ACI4KF_00280 [Huintestinicola sp.]